MVTTGVLGGRWRATVTPWGGLVPWDGSPPLNWFVAADDRWHVPAEEAAVRQQRVDGTPVVETKLRIPNGDAVQRVYSVADHGGLAVVEVENQSPLPIAVAFDRGDLLTALPPTAPIEGISLPEGSIAVPVGHRATVTVVLRHQAPEAGPLPPLPPVAGVVRGWTTIIERAGRYLLPDQALCERIAAARSELALAGPDHPDDDPSGFVIGVGQLVRMGEEADPWLPDVAAALEVAGRSGPHDWAFGAALAAAERVFASVDDRRAVRDVGALRAAAGRQQAGRPDAAPEGGARLVAWAELALADGAVLLPMGLPADWVGTNFEAYSVPTGPASSVSFAVRWHGARPALLWEQKGEPVELSAPLVAPAWRSADAKGETLWPAPQHPLPADGGSFA
ncbi:MAG: hypothetical protein H6513_00405 [Acidimicrobiaceae bacterium]|nr:hypothetical protein [Ilumatobacter sp.]MCB9379130.1 hypothetical protein [Acidimicrobiaceae bacterium]MCO5331816.1 hypothetical protein [Ilumatobacteraceae bacterium]